MGGQAFRQKALWTLVLKSGTLAFSPEISQKVWIYVRTFVIPQHDERKRATSVAPLGWRLGMSVTARNLTNWAGTRA